MFSFFAAPAESQVPQQNPIELYRANPRTYSWTVNGTTYTNNRNPFGFEIYACRNPDGTYDDNSETVHNDCIPSATTRNNEKLWSSSLIPPTSNRACSSLQIRYDGPTQNFDTKSTNSTGNSNASTQVCGIPDVSNSTIPFITRTVQLNYNASLCAGNNAVVLASRADPSNSECSALDYNDLMTNPENYSQSQRACLIYYDDYVELRACRNNNCITNTYGSPNPDIPTPANAYINLCNLFTLGNGQYDITFNAFDYQGRMYGSSSFWLTWLSNTATPPSGAGNITDLNFAITNSIPWLQTYGLDTRFDNGFTSDIPQAPTCPAYATNRSTSTTTPGIIFSGDASSSFGQGDPSTTNWLAGGTNFSEVFSPSSVSPTSYDSLLTKASRTGITITDLPCTLSNCNIPPNLASGVYRANGNVSLNAHNFNANRQFVFLINGSLTITGPITVQNGSVVFSARDNITVNRTVGAAANTCPIPDGQIQGLFSADNNIVIDGENNCTTSPDRMLNVEGALVVNASGTGGSFSNERDLCGANPTTPSFTVTERLDLLLNAPPLLLKQATFFYEDAP